MAKRIATKLVETPGSPLKIVHWVVSLLSHC
jgi:hypothetical protein